MRIRDHGLLLANLALFAVFLGGMLLVGHHEANQQRLEHGQPETSLAAYAGSPDFGQAVFENWESEFLQMGMYVVLTAYLFKRGSAESRPLDSEEPQDEHPAGHRGDPDAPWPVRRGGPVLLWLYSHSLAMLFAVLFLGSVWAHAVTGAGKYSEEQLEHGGVPVTTWDFVRTSEFWFESLQNWQSEFLAVAVLVWATVWLRQYRSPQSKPVHAPHAETGV